MSTGPLITGKRPLQLPWLCLAVGSLGLGLVGTLLPLIPTTPFVLLAAWAAPKGSPQLEAWLRDHHLFGPLLINWREQRAIATSAKLSASVAMLFSWLVLYTLGYSIVFLIALAALFMSVGIFLLTRPTPQTRLSHD